MTVKKYDAFTLAEVLITLGVIGVVAAITMPMLITNINERINSERQANIVYKITQAMEQMRAHGKLISYDSTESFVDELQKYLKITKRCDSEHIAECWPVETVTKGDGEEFSIADAKKGKNLSLTTDTNNVGLILADGASLILNYNTSFEGLDIGDKVETSSISLPVGNNKTKVFQYTTNVTGPIAFIMDVNGKKGPNSETRDNKYHDIRNFGGALLTEGTPAFTCPGDTYNDTCVYYIGNSYSSISCTDSTSDNYQYCLPYSSGYGNDYWAGANAKCASMNMSLPTIEQLQNIYNNRANYPSLPPLGWTWTSEIYNYYGYDEHRAYVVDFSMDGYLDNGYKDNPNYAVCVK